MVIGHSETWFFLIKINIYSTKIHPVYEVNIELKHTWAESLEIYENWENFPDSVSEQMDLVFISNA